MLNWTIYMILTLYSGKNMAYRKFFFLKKNSIFNLYSNSIKFFSLLVFILFSSIIGTISGSENSGSVSREHLGHQFDNPIFTFETIDSGLGFVYSKNYSLTSPELEPSLYVYISFFKPEINQFTDPFIIYQTTKPQNSISINLKFAECMADTLGVGYQCVLQLRNITSIDSLNNVYGKNVVLLISFLSSGSVTGIKKLTG